MARVIWAREALRNLDAIGDYVRQDSAEYASALIEAMIDAVAVLQTFPRAGRVVPEFADERLRELIFERYRIVYSVGGDAVIVNSILHSAMDVARRLRAHLERGE